MPATLALAELRSLARLVQAGLLALDDAGVARQEALTLQRDAHLGIGLDERACDAVPDRAGLARLAAAVHADAQVVRRRGLGHLERCENHLLVHGAREVVRERATVDPRLPVARPQDHPRDGRLPLPGAEVLRDLAHGSSSGFGAWAAWGWSGPAYTFSFVICADASLFFGSIPFTALRMTSVGRRSSCSRSVRCLIPPG